MSLLQSLFPGALFVVVFLVGIRLMGSVRTALFGNLLGSIGMLSAIVYSLFIVGVIDLTAILVPIGIGALIGYLIAIRVAMIRMPQLVAFLNGLGGGASAATALVVLAGSSPVVLPAAMALFVGGTTLGGSLLASAKLERILPQKPVVFRYHLQINIILLIFSGILITAMLFEWFGAFFIFALVLFSVSLGFGIVFTVRIGGADMPITISLLNSFSGLAASVAGFAVSDPILVATGAIVGSAGLILTRSMCRAMNRSLSDILLSKEIGSNRAVAIADAQKHSPIDEDRGSLSEPRGIDHAVSLLNDAASIFFVPGYGMALSQAQHEVKRLSDLLEKAGKEVKFAIHPVAGRMPGHMYVLLAEAEVPYEKMLEIEVANPLFPATDVVIVVGANDVVNPSATSAEGTPIYGMPILNVYKAREIIIVNKDLLPGYAGVPNPLYEREGVTLLTGDASQRIGELIERYTGK